MEEGAYRMGAPLKLLDQILGECIVKITYDIRYISTFTVKLTWNLKTILCFRLHQSKYENMCVQPESKDKVICMNLTT